MGICSYHRITRDDQIQKFFGLLILVFSMIFFTSCAKQGPFDIQITGLTNHKLQGTIFYESISTGQQIYIQETGPGEDIRVLTITFPPQESPTNLRLTTQGPVKASYFESVGGISRQYWRNVSGDLSLHKAGDSISGVIDFTAFAPDSNESIRVTGSFEEILLQNSSTSSGDFTSAAVILVMIFLLGFNFIFQFYVGHQLYADEGNALLKSLRGTRTFIRGWQVPELRKAMISWSIVLLSLIIILCSFGAMAVTSR